MIKASLLFLIFFFIFSCASLGKKPLPPGARRAPVTESQIGPERAASNAMIEKGEAKLRSGEYERAFDLFQEAVNFDPNNGVGFYYLAYVKYKTGEYDQVPNFLAKAEALLSSSKEWMERINLLKQDTNPSGY
ncbi:MAG: hypothetical protein HYY44_09590 [Deltaproteobacteria bacterium]|nr:hypothetical protein [Deltaproteobacteria bacterium]MBI4373276.1 hypothetical protein [Deltaproteobacteria bacterium]